VTALMGTPSGRLLPDRWSDVAGTVVESYRIRWTGVIGSVVGFRRIEWTNYAGICTY
jgi:hypothetical protein